MCPSPARNTSKRGESRGREPSNQPCGLRWKAPWRQAPGHPQVVCVRERSFELSFIAKASWMVTMVPSLPTGKLALARPTRWSGRPNRKSCMGSFLGLLRTSFGTLAGDMNQHTQLQNVSGRITVDSVLRTSSVLPPRACDTGMWIAAKTRSSWSVHPTWKSTMKSCSACTGDSKILILLDVRTRVFSRLPGSEICSRKIRSKSSS